MKYDRVDDTNCEVEKQSFSQTVGLVVEKRAGNKYSYLHYAQ